MPLGSPVYQINDMDLVFKKALANNLNKCGHWGLPYQLFKYSK